MFTEPIKRYVRWEDNQWPCSSPVTLIFHHVVSLPSAMLVMQTCQIKGLKVRTSYSYVMMLVVIPCCHRRVKRVVNSTLAAECLAAVEASDASIALSSLLSSMLGCPRFPISVLCDNKSLVDNVHSSTAVDNKRLQIDISILRDDLHQKNIHELRWIETSLQVANCLTKNGCSSQYLLDIMRLRKRFDFNTGGGICVTCCELCHNGG